MRSLLILFVTLCHLIQAQDNGYPAPTGIYCSCPPTSSFSDSVIDQVTDKDYLTGVLIRVSWNDINPSPGIYDWTLIDEQLQRLEDAGKLGTLAVINGRYYPDWLNDDPEFESFEYLFRGIDTINIAVPWNPAYLDAWTKFVEELGARYDTNPLLRLIRITHATSNGMEFQMPESPSDKANWLGIGYTHNKHFDSWKTVIDSYNKAFRILPLDLDFHPVNVSQVSEGLSGDQLSIDVYGYARTSIGPRFAALAAWWSRKNSSYAYPGQHSLLLDSVNTEFATTQFVGSFQDNYSDRFEAQNEQEAALDMLQYTFDESSIRYMEIWNADLVSPDELVVSDYYRIAAEIEAPTAPGNVMISITESGPQLSWGPSSDAIAYKIYRAENEEAAFKLFERVEGVEDFQINEDTKSIGTPQYFVTAVNSKQNESWFSSIVSAPEVLSVNLWFLY